MILEGFTVDAEELRARTGWEVKPEGLCKGAVCVPLPDSATRGEMIDVRLVAERLGMPLVQDEAHDLWALGPESLTGRTLTCAEAPELVLPDLDDRPFSLSSLRGQKVVLATWASWCGCRLDLPAWQELRSELHPRGVEIVTIALDIDPEAARPWIEAARPEHPSLIDSTHVVGELFGVTNVPSSVWIDEDGLLVRPAEIANILPSVIDRLGIDIDAIPATRREGIVEARKFRFEPDTYLSALRDWVDHGAASRYAMSSEDVIARSRPRSLDTATAAARFELGELLHELGEVEAAQRQWREAHRLQPENWTYKRQAWELIDPVDEGGQSNVKHIYDSNWLDDVKRFGADNYYPAFEA